jgi:predicted RNA-binding Zn ribbon-like protein
MADTTRHPLFRLLGEPLAVDLVNTLIAPTFGGDLVATPGQVVEWLRAEADRLPADALEPPEVERLAALRHALRALFDAALDGTAPPPAPLRTVNAASLAATPYVELDWTAGGGPQAHARGGLGQGGDPGILLLAEIARSGIQLLGGSDRNRLRRCEGPDCTLLFVATNRRRRWCAPHLCGNRVRVARHHRRTRGKGGI